MSALSIGDTAIAGLRLARKRPLALLYWFGLTVLISGAGVALMYGTGAMDFYKNLAAQSASADPAAMMASMGRLFGLFGLMLPIYLLFFSVMVTAAVRAVLQPEKSAFGYLRFGAAELRTLVVLVVIWVLVAVAYAFLVFVAALLGAAAAMGGAAAGGGGAGAGIFAVLFMVAVIIAVIVALVWFATRMSLAVPQSFDTRSINIFGTWTITKGNTGKLFLAYLLAFLIYFGISLVGGLINVAIMGGSLASLAKSAAGNPADMAAMFQSMGPAMVVNTLVSGVVATLGTAVMVCPTAEAYLELGNRSQRDAEVFA